jgi:two-component system sensor histidine kinase MtrB
MRTALGGPWRAAAVAGALVAVGALLAGCASMPSSGEVSRVGSEQNADANAQVRVYGVKPQKGETPEQIVRGFLEATTSDEADYATALEYLTPKLAKTWNPNAMVTVLSSGPTAIQTPAAVGGNARSASVSLTGDRVATVDSEHAYHASAGTYRSGVHLTKVGSEWRIDRVSDGLVLGQADFQRIYQSVDMYYFAPSGPGPGPGPGAGVGSQQRNVLVADPVYMRARINLLGTTVQTLLNGPTDWLRPAVDSAFPAGAKATAVSLDDSQRLRVRLNKAGSAGIDAQRCRRMAAQLIETVKGMASPKPASVEVDGANGAAVCSLSRDQTQSYAPGGPGGTASRQFYIDSGHHLVSLAGDGTQAQRVAGPFGAGQVPLESVAVQPDEKVAAGVYVAAVARGTTSDKLVLTSRGPKDGERLSAPSWDGYGDLWVADRDPANPRLLMLPGGTGAPVQVVVRDLGKGRIESLRVAPDGVRIALLVREGGITTLQLGRIERSGTQAKPQIVVAGLRLVTPPQEDVKAASWAGASRLVVAQVSGGVEQIQYVGEDGSASFTSTLPGIGGVVSVAGSVDPNRPLLAEYNGGIFRLLPDGNNWKRVSPEGTAPVYPG